MSNTLSGLQVAGSPFTKLHREMRDRIVENLIDIVDRVLMEDLLRVCLVCKDLHDASTRIIYRDLNFVEYDSEKLWRCLETLASNTKAAQAVRSLSFRSDRKCSKPEEWGGSDPRDTLTANQARIFSAAIQNISKGLTGLELKHGPPLGLTESLTGGFPRLQKLDLHEITPCTLSLIRNSPDLKIIHISEVTAFTPTTEAIHVLRLEELPAPSSIICAITSGTEIERASIFGRIESENNQRELLEALAKLSSPGNSLKRLGIMGSQLDKD